VNPAELFSLRDQVVLAAGGAGYLGLPACQALAHHGARLMIADIQPERLAEAARTVPGAATIALDVASEESIAAAVAATVNQFGRLDVLVNATYGTTSKSLADLSAADFDRANRLNITGTFLLARAAANAMADGSRMILFASMYGLVAPEPANYRPPQNPNPIEYGAGKAAVVQITRYLAAHYGRRGIRVNAVVPGAFPHPATQNADPGFVERLAARTMLGRIGRREETAGAVVYLASPAASYRGRSGGPPGGVRGPRRSASRRLGGSA